MRRTSENLTKECFIFKSKTVADAMTLKVMKAISYARWWVPRDSVFYGGFLYKLWPKIIPKQSCEMNLGIVNFNFISPSRNLVAALSVDEFLRYRYLQFTVTEIIGVLIVSSSYCFFQLKICANLWENFCQCWIWLNLWTISSYNYFFLQFSFSEFSDFEKQLALLYVFTYTAALECLI